MTEMLVLGVVMLVFAGIAGYAYVDMKRRIDTIESRETLSPGQLSDGPVAVQGTVALADVDPLVAPLTGEDAVVVDWERVEEPDDEELETEHGGRRGVDFVIAGEDGQVRIEPGGLETLTVSSSARTREHVLNAGSNDGLIDGLEAFDADVRDDEDGFYYVSSEKMSMGLRNDSGEYEFSQEILTPGDDCYLVGQAERDENGELVVRGGGDGPYLLSNMDEDSLAESLEGDQPLILLAVAVFLAASVYGFVKAAGLF